MSKSAFPESDNFAFVESGSMYQAQTEPVMDPGAVTVEVSGTIKWFDVSKGFGFIIPDDGSPDVLLHATRLEPGAECRQLPSNRWTIRLLCTRRRPRSPERMKLLSRQAGSFG